MLAVGAFLLHPLAEDGVRLITQSIRTAIPALFWWLCIETFTDRPKRFRWGVGFALYSVLAPAIHLVTFGSTDAGSPVLHRLLIGLPQLVEYGLILTGLGVVLYHWRDDLIPTRRRLRGWLLGFAGVIILTQVALEQWVEAGQIGKLLLADIALIAIACLLLTGRTGVLLGHASPQPQLTNNEPAEPDLEISRERRALNQAIQNGLYRQEGLTLATFARAIKLPEYKTRQLINQELGFRNFPDFVNHYRLADACRHLKETPDEPITTIALDMGFRSVSSFNRVFKEHLGMTPTQYRKAGASAGEA
ncbi:transcriptional regulator [Saccharospirillum salsuginis]|uniref:Transcriptional regulator n=2 Tax=Saccharospirillum salsuginis TaxID=418750 RepID=A0A918KD26_9GAMM|nr:transcriptional regulator [Saccharospirillum salsuginis]